jgi:hypothetical protein
MENTLAQTYNLYFSIPLAFLDLSIMFLDRLGKYLK